MASQGIQPAKLVLLGDMGAGKSSLVLRFVKGQFTDYQVSSKEEEEEEEEEKTYQLSPSSSSCFPLQKY